MTFILLRIQERTLLSLVIKKKDFAKKLLRLNPVRIYLFRTFYRAILICNPYQSLIHMLYLVYSSSAPLYT